MTHTAFVRPAWTPVTIAMMIVGFMLFWPLGLAMLAYILWGDRLEQFKSNVNRATDRAGQSFSGSWGRGCGHKRHGRHDYHSRTGNVAFDEWRDGELERLEEERRKLDEMRAEFDEYLRELRRARDSEEFEAFRKAHEARKTPADPQGGPAGPKGRRSVPDV
ncbi:MAG: DUF2852 domain-containing protein [Nitratireductor sp.]|nr:DUF2852 domain-containing protein [Nitratireductor sp.]